MANNIQTHVSKDLTNKKLKVTREFDAPLEPVWRAWTESKLLDQWWAPAPYKARTKSLDFRVGGIWHYCMMGPDAHTPWCIVEFTFIKENSQFKAISSFGDEKGNKNPDLPKMYWDNVFIPKGKSTMVEVEISFDQEAGLEQIIAMGFEAGFSSALGNLDQLLVK